MRIFIVQLITFFTVYEVTCEEKPSIPAYEVYPNEVSEDSNDFVKHRSLLRRYVSGTLTTTTTEGPWTGRWLPERTTLPSVKKLNSKNPFFSYETPTDPLHGVAMGIPVTECDDGKTNLEMDWNFSPVNYTCYNPGYQYKPNRELPPLLEKEAVPPLYLPLHICMDKPITYNRPIPTFGNHRPLWPKYGEYKFVPVQRWLHSLEHGAVVMLYHPCANPVEVNRLRKIVKGCLRRYIITPYTLMDEQRPMAVVVWSWRLTMSTVDAGAVKKFIVDRALKGPEKLSVDGQFGFGLQVPSEVVKGSNYNDDNLCPNYN
ncbi:hypothetical protein J437_LFUL005967 [Ladona fulva]|uniref:Tumor protein p53-inducible protein 13 n=1 Tax=Ladona fulva TaxID=123851 RepID=A0A8K0K091_LADFU|nr:hypothetical protein J437_LFUL005967 [Ladona fulva]